MGITFIDKLAHVLEYLVLGFLTFTALVRSGNKNSISLGVTFIAAGVFGILDELHQFLIPGRTVELLDIVSNVSGVVIGATIPLLFRRWILRTSTPSLQPPDSK